MTTETSGVPGYLSGWMAPLADEIEAIDLPVDGAIPPELDGRYLRNGSNPLPGIDPGHNFTGQGMLHGVRLGQGRAKWYRNRWVKTPMLDGARPVRSDGSRDLTASTANTSVLRYGDALFALVENSLPFAITPDLATIGPYDFHGKLDTPMTAHPRWDPSAEELHFFGYDMRPPFVTYHVASSDGQLVHSAPISVPAPTMMHDFGITEHHVVWLDLPVVLDMELTKRRGIPFRWSDDYRARIGIMPRRGHNADIRWFDVSPRYAFHLGNAHEDAAGRVVIEAASYDREAFNTTWEALGGASVLKGEHDLSGGTFRRWVIDPAKGVVSEDGLDDLPIDYPTFHAALTGRANRYTYAVNLPLLTDKVGGKIVKYDRATGGRAMHELGKEWVPGEVMFVPARGATAEDDGFLISIATHATADAARLLVHAASRLSDPPVAVVTLPRRVPAGFHGAWVPEPGPSAAQP